MASGDLLDSSSSHRRFRDVLLEEARRNELLSKIFVATYSKIAGRRFVISLGEVRTDASHVAKSCNGSHTSLETANDKRSLSLARARGSTW